MASAISEYGYISAKLKARMSTLLTEERLDQAIRSQSLQEAFLPFRGSYLETLEGRYSATGDLKMVEADLASLEFSAHIALLPHLPKNSAAFVKMKAQGIESELLKSALRLWFDAHARGRPIGDRAGYIYRGKVLGFADLGAVVNAPTAKDASLALKDSPYGTIVEAGLPKAVESGSIFGLEHSLDRLFFQNLFVALASLGAADGEIARRFIAIEVDIYNINNLVRLRSYSGFAADKVGGYLIDFGTAIPAAALAEAYGSEDIAKLAAAVFGAGGEAVAQGFGGADVRARLASLERLLRGLRIAEARKRLAGNPFSIGIPLAYLALLSEQLRDVRTILNAKYFGISEERLRSFL